MRKAMVIALALMLAVTIGATVGAKQVTIRFYSMHMSYEPMASALMSIIAEFERQNPDIDIEPEPVSEVERHTKFVAEMEAGAGPDVISIGPGFVRPYYEAGYLVSLDAYLNADPSYIGQFVGSAVEACTWGGNVYAIPHWGGAEGVLMYNKEMFRAAGLDENRPPETWEEFLAYAQALTRDTDGDGEADQWGYAFRSSRQEGTTEILRTWLWANGASILDSTETQSLIDSPEAIEALRFLTDLALVNNVVPPSFANISGGEISTLFAEGKVAMYYDGPWAPGSVLAHNPEMAGKLGVAAPMARKYRMSPSIFVANGITRDCENPDAAWRFIQYLSNVESNIVYAQASGFQSMRKDVPADATTDDPLIMQFADILVQYGQMIEQVPHKSDIDIIVATALQEILLQVKSVEQAAADAARQIEALLQ